MYKVKETDYAWAAGFIDGEGTVTIRRTTRKRKSGDDLIYYRPHISVSQADEKLHKLGVFRMQKIFNGGMSYCASKPPRLWTYTWTVCDQKALTCAKKVLPYMIIKKKNIKLIIRYFETRTIFRDGTGKLPRLTKQELTKRRKLFDKMRLLNKKGFLPLQRLNESARINEM